MDWGLLLGGGAFALSLVGTTSGFVYLIMRLITNPLKEDLDELQVSVKEISDKLKSEDDLNRMIDLAIARHKETCPGK